MATDHFSHFLAENLLVVYSIKNLQLFIVIYNPNTIGSTYLLHSAPLWVNTILIYLLVLFSSLSLLEP